MKFKTLLEALNTSIQFGQRGPEVKDLQDKLAILGFELPVYGIDGIFGYETLAASKAAIAAISNISGNVAVVTSNVLTTDQIELIANTSKEPELVNSVRVLADKELEAIRKMDVIFSDLITNYNEHPDAFIAKLKDIAVKLKVNPNWLLLVMYKESGLNPKAVNKFSGASGLLQFMPSTAQGLNTSVEEIRSMDSVQQLDYVYLYLKRWTGQFNSVLDVYMAVFYPVAIAKGDDFVMGSERSDSFARKVAAQNPIVGKQDYITKGDFKRYVLRGIPSDYVAKINEPVQTQITA